MKGLTLILLKTLFVIANSNSLGFEDTVVNL